MVIKRNVIHIVLKGIAVCVLLQVAAISTSYAAPPADGGKDNSGVYHTVQYGETLYSIGRHYGIDPRRIAEANGLSGLDYVYAGQILHIPSSYGYNRDQSKDYRRDRGKNYRPPRDRYPQDEHSYYYYPQVGYGYDFTGYYYETYYPDYRRYSYTCGYHYNCY